MKQQNFNNLDDIKKDLINLGHGKFVSKTDPFFWVKVLQNEPDNEKALYHVSLIREEESYSFLKQYKETNREIYYKRHKKSKQEAIELMEKSWNKGYYMARKELERMKNNKKDKKINTSKKGFTKGQIFLLGLLLFLLGFIFAILFLSYQVNIINNTENNFYSIIPYEIYEEIPDFTNDSTIFIEKVIYLSGKKERQYITNLLIDEMKKVHNIDKDNPYKIILIDKELRKEVGIAIWREENSPIQVYIYPSSLTFNNEKEYQVWESTTILRSALYQFVKDKGYMPNNLDDLTKPFPNNYLTALPKEPYFLANAFYSFKNEKGGWVYQPKTTIPISDSELKILIKDVLYPNLNINNEIPFEPLTLQIIKQNNSVILTSGNYLIREYPVALGKNDSTPFGNFSINKKIMMPNQNIPLKNNDYGTRSMELSDPKYAIHGTNQPQSIGKNVSNGCVRLSSSNIEELYSMTPLGTSVLILDSPNNYNRIPNTFIKPNLYTKSFKQSETDNSKLYHWAK